MTARALAYMFIFSVTTMSLLSLKRNPGNFWLMAGNRPELVYTWQEMLLIYPCTSLSSDTDAPRHVSLLILLPMESFTDAAFPLPRWRGEWRLLELSPKPGFHPAFPVAPLLAHGITPVRPGWCWWFKMQNSQQYPREPHPEGLMLGLRLSSSRGEVPPRGQIPGNGVGWHQHGAALDQCLGITPSTARPTQELLPVRILLETLGILHSSSHRL